MLLTSKMELFEKIVSGFETSNVFAKSFIFDVCNIVNLSLKLKYFCANSPQYQVEMGVKYECSLVNMLCIFEHLVRTSPV